MSLGNEQRLKDLAAIKHIDFRLVDVDLGWRGFGTFGQLEVEGEEGHAIWEDGSHRVNQRSTVAKALLDRISKLPARPPPVETALRARIAELEHLLAQANANNVALVLAVSSQGVPSKHAGTAINPLQPAESQLGVCDDPEGPVAGVQTEEEIQNGSGLSPQYTDPADTEEATPTASEAGNSTEPARHVWAKLVALDCHQSSFELAEPLDSYRLGRDPSKVEFVLASGAVSNIQCRIFRIVEAGVPDAIMLVNHSRFGTTVDGKMLGSGEQRLISHGMEVFFGSNLGKGFMFQVFPKPAASQRDSPFEAKYCLQQVIGNGSFSTVRLAINRESGDKVAVKVIETARFAFNTKVMEALDLEVQIMRSLIHQNIVCFLDHFKEQGVIYIVLEFVNGGDLLGYVRARKNLVEDKARFFLHQIVVALKFLKSRGIIHRDLKPANFLVELNTEVLKLADFGVAKQCVDGFNAKTLCGTPAYLAPEILLPHASYDNRVDVYSMGAILFFLLSGMVPFDDDDQQVIFNKIRCGTVDWSAKVWEDVSPTAVDLVRRLMQVQPEQRMALDEVEAHPWMQREHRMVAHEGGKVHGILEQGADECLQQVVEVVLEGAGEEDPVLPHVKHAPLAVLASPVMTRAAAAIIRARKAMLEEKGGEAPVSARTRSKMVVETVMDSQLQPLKRVVVKVQDKGGGKKAGWRL